MVRDRTVVAGRIIRAGQALIPAFYCPPRNLQGGSDREAIRDQWDHSLLTRLDDPEEEMRRLNVWRAMTAVIATSPSPDIPYHGRLEGNSSHRRFTTGQAVKQPEGSKRAQIVKVLTSARVLGHLGRLDDQ